MIWFRKSWCSSLQFCGKIWYESDPVDFLEGQKQEILSTFLNNLVKLSNNFEQYRNMILNKINYVACCYSERTNFSPLNFQLNIYAIIF